MVQWMTKLAHEGHMIVQWMIRLAHEGHMMIQWMTRLAHEGHMMIQWMTCIGWGISPICAMEFGWLIIYGKDRIIYIVGFDYNCVQK